MGRATILAREKGGVKDKVQLPHSKRGGLLKKPKWRNSKTLMEG